MSNEEVKEFISRPINDFPVADFYLKTVDGNLKKPWEYKDSSTVLRERTAIKLKKLGLYSLVIKLRNIFKS